MSIIGLTLTPTLTWRSPPLNHQRSELANVALNGEERTQPIKEIEPTLLLVATTREPSQRSGLGQDIFERRKRTGPEFPLIARPQTCQTGSR